MPTGLDRPQVAAGVEIFHEVRRKFGAKLDGGTQAFFPTGWTGRACRWEKVLSNILLVARQRPVINPKPVHGRQRRRAAVQRNRGIRTSAQGIAGGGRGHSPRADLLRHAADVSRGLRASAAENAFPTSRIPCVTCPGLKAEVF